MKASLSSLEQKVERFVAYCQGLRAENTALRGRVSELEAERQSLVDKIEATRTRLEALMTRLPDE
jgi:cell division protein ZapB